MNFGNTANLLDSEIAQCRQNKQITQFYRQISTLVRVNLSIINGGSEISLFKKCFLNQQVLKCYWILIEIALYK